MSSFRTNILNRIEEFGAGILHVYANWIIYAKNKVGALHKRYLARGKTGSKVACC